MSPEASESLQRARRSLAKAETMLNGSFPDEAGRLAYGAGLNAARAYVFERTGLVAKTHSGTHSEFGRLVRDEPAFSNQHRAFLGQTYKMKTAADYGDGVPADADAARDAIGAAAGLITAIETAIAAMGNGEGPQ